MDREKQPNEEDNEVEEEDKKKEETDEKKCKCKEEEEETPELQDPQQILRENCRSECEHHASKLGQCNERVLSKTETKETCMEELIDLLGCVDHCVAHDLFKRLR